MTILPRVTVLTTVYNGARFLDEAIGSVLSQDYRDIEHVIVDDGSTDATPRILDDWARRDDRVVLVRLEQNRGVGFATNRGLDVARGEYIARHDSDDVALPGRIAAQIAALDADPTLALVATHYDIIDARSRVLLRMSEFERPAINNYLLNFTNPLGPHSQTMFRRDDARAVGGYDEAHLPAADYDFLTRIATRGAIAVLPIVGMRYRIHDTQITARQRDAQLRRVLEIAQRQLARFLQRDVSFDEINAVRSVWGRSEAPTRASFAQRVLEETFARFSASDGDCADRVRYLTARRWMISVAGQTEKAQRMKYALQWHRRGAMAGATRAFRAIASRMLR